MYSPPHESEPRSQVVSYFILVSLIFSFNTHKSPCMQILTLLLHKLVCERTNILFLVFFAGPPAVKDESTPARCDAHHVSVRVQSAVFAHLLNGAPAVFVPSAHPSDRWRAGSVSGGAVMESLLTQLTKPRALT